MGSVALNALGARQGDPNLATDLRAAFRIPIFGGPMFIASTQALVIAQCKAGIVGSRRTGGDRRIKSYGPAARYIDRHAEKYADARAQMAFPN